MQLFLGRSYVKNHVEYVVPFILGSGSFGNVFLCHVKEKSMASLEAKVDLVVTRYSWEELPTVAIKFMKNPSGTSPEKNVVFALKEVEMYMEIRQFKKSTGRTCENIVLFYDYFHSITAVSIGLVLEYFPHDDYGTYILNLDVDEVHHYMGGLLKALDYLHSIPNSIVHGDIKPGNCLYQRRRKLLKLCDFGLALSSADVSGCIVECPSATAFLSQGRNQGDSPLLATYGFRSFEALLSCRHHSPRVDVWAAGCIFFMILHMNLLIWSPKTEVLIAHLRKTRSYPKVTRSDENILCLAQIMARYGEYQVKKAVEAIGYPWYGKQQKQGYYEPSMSDKVKKARRTWLRKTRIP